MKPSKAVNVHSFFNGIGDSIINIFLPVLIMIHLGDLFAVMWYIFIRYATSIIVIALLHKVCAKFPIVVLFVNMIPMLLSPILLSILPFTFGLCVLLGILGGIVHGLYYVTMDNFQIRAHTKINIAKFDAFCNLGHFVFAIMSAFILGSALDNSLVLTCILAIIMYLCSIIPLILAQRVMKKVEVKLPKQNKMPKSKYYIFTPLFVAFFGVGNFIYSMILPVYMYEIGASIELVGITFGLVYLLDIAVDFLGRHLRLKNKHYLPLITYATTFVLCMLAIMVLPSSSIMLIIVSTLCSLSYLLCYICIIGEMMSNLKQDNCAVNTLGKVNSIFSVNRLVGLCLFFIFPSYTTIWIFGIICAIMSLIFGIISIKNRKLEEKELENNRQEIQQNEEKTA